LKIWLINAYGNLPNEGWSEYRTTLMSKALSDAGHNVIWWVSNFEHRSKKFRSSDWKDIEIDNNFTIRIVPSTAYYKHISIARIRYEIKFCKNILNKAIELNDFPDFVIVGEPALFTNHIIKKLVSTLKSQLIIDIIDLWPELFRILLPKFLVKYDKIIFSPLYLSRKLFLKKADAIVAVTNDYLDIGKKEAKAKYYETIYLGFNSSKLKKDYPIELTNSILKNYKIEPKSNIDFFVIYAGTLSNNYDINSILLTSLKLKVNNNINIKIIIAGDGPYKDSIIDFIQKNNLNNLFYIGRIENETLEYIYSVCDLALCTYVKDSSVSIPMKFYDYISSGLPVLCSLNREIGQLITKYNIGRFYISENHIDMYKQIISLSSNPSLINSMKKNSINLSSSFTYEKQYYKIVDLIEKMVIKK
jgi:hypothetical protein